jgi:hypothetical protein
VLGGTAPRWVALASLVMFFAAGGVAFVDYEMVRSDADAARIAAVLARVECRYSSPARIDARRRQNALCDRLPGPLRVQDRVERRWERRAPWYGVVAIAALLLTALTFVLSRRRRFASESAPAGRWHWGTVAASSGIGVTIWAALFYLVADRWDNFVEATGGTTAECGPGSNCGALGEFTEAHPVVLLSFMLIGTAVPAIVFAWSIGRGLRFLDLPAKRPLPERAS